MYNFKYKSILIFGRHGLWHDLCFDTLYTILNCDLHQIKVLIRHKPILSGAK